MDDPYGTIIQGSSGVQKCGRGLLSREEGVVSVHSYSLQLAQRRLARGILRYDVLA